MKANLETTASVNTTRETKTNSGPEKLPYFSYCRREENMKSKSVYWRTRGKQELVADIMPRILQLSIRPAKYKNTEYKSSPKGTVS